MINHFSEMLNYDLLSIINIKKTNTVFILCIFVGISLMWKKR